MSDFDFDEIDKAVAGVLSPEDTARLSADSSTSTPVESPAQPAVEVPKPAEVDSPAVEEPAVVRSAPPAAPAARRSSGRFMDVVHPSSDMRTRSGAPVFSNTSTDASRPTTFVPPAKEQEEVPEAEASTESEANEAWSKPLESPFLADAKVEKRPLGTFAAADFNPEELLESSEEELKLEEPDDPRLEATTLPDPIDFAAQTEVIESEVGDTSMPVASVEETQLDEATEPTEPALELMELEPAVKAEEPTLALVEEPTGPTSISQQYTEQPRNEQTSGAIYDTENYHQAVAVAPKKRSGIWAIIWIILLVILGAGAGVAFYLFVLPML